MQYPELPKAFWAPPGAMGKDSALHVTLVPNPCHLQAGELSRPPLLQTMESKSTQKRGLCPILYLNFSQAVLKWAWLIGTIKCFAGTQFLHLGQRV